MIKALLLSSLALNVGLLLGRLSGFVREIFVAATYGATAQADIVVLMLTVPDLLVNILMGGALSAVLIPEFTRYPENARKLLYQALVFFGIVFLCITIVLYSLADVLVAILAPGFNELNTAQAAIVLGWVIWLVPLTVLAGVSTAYLHSQNKFLVASLGTLIINSSIICGLLLVYYGYGAMWLVAIFVLIGGLLRLFSQLTRIRFVWNPIKSLNPKQLSKSLLIRYGHVMLSGSVLLLFPVVARALASYEGEGSVALFNYSFRLIEFPLVIAVTFLSTVFYPRLAQSFSDSPAQHRQLIRYGIQITLGLSIVAAITLISLSGEYVEFVFGYGDMQISSLSTITELIAIGFIALPLQGLSVFLTSVFNSRQDTRTPMLLNGVGLVFFLISNKVGLFGQGLESLMVGLVISYGLICVLQLIFLRIDLLSWWSVFIDKNFLPGIFMAVVVSSSISSWIGMHELSSWLSLLLACLSALVALLIMALLHEKIRKNIKIRFI